MKKTSEAVSLDIQGDQVQGVGLRKKLHALIDKHKVSGLAVNDPVNNEVQAVLDAPARKRKLIKRILAKQIKKETGSPVTITEKAELPEMKDISMSSEQMQDLSANLYLKFLQSHKAEGKDLWKHKPDISIEKAEEDMLPRYRLKKEEDGSYTGRVPELARKQLMQEEAPYYYMLDDALVTDKETAMKKMHPTDQAYFNKAAFLHGYTNETMMSKEAFEYVLYKDAGLLDLFDGVGRAVKRSYNSGITKLPEITANPAKAVVYSKPVKPIAEAVTGMLSTMAVNPLYRIPKKMKKSFSSLNKSKTKLSPEAYKARRAKVISNTVARVKMEIGSGIAGAGTAVTTKIPGSGDVFQWLNRKTGTVLNKQVTKRAGTAIDKTPLKEVLSKSWQKIKDVGNKDVKDVVPDSWSKGKEVWSNAKKADKVGDNAVTGVVKSLSAIGDISKNVGKSIKDSTIRAKELYSI